MSDIFVNASDARLIATSVGFPVYNEVRSIETLMLAAISSGALTLTVTTTTFTTDPTYYSVYNNLTTNRLKSLYLTIVVNYFTNLGYSFVIATNPNTSGSNTTLQYIINW